MSEQVRRRGGLVMFLLRAVRRPYLLMAAILLIIGAIWFARLALQEFLLLDRLVNVYTNDAQLKMDAFAIKPGVTAEVLEVLASEGEQVRAGQVLIRLKPDEFQVELRKAEAAAEATRLQLQEGRLANPLAIQQARQEVDRAQAMLDAKQHSAQRATVLVSVQRDRVVKMKGEHQAVLEGTRARVQEQEAALREAETTLQRSRKLFQDGIVAQGRLDTDQAAFERAQARLVAAQEQVRQTEQHYPPGDSPEMVRVHEKDAQRAANETEEQRLGLEVARTRLRMVELGGQRLQVLESRLREAEAQVAALQLKLDKTTIVSPIDGIVGLRKVEPGEIVTAGSSSPTLMLIHDPRSLSVSANVWESDISRVQVGLLAEIWVDAFKTSALGRGKPYKGRVERINPTTSSEVSSLPPERFFARREQKVPIKITLEHIDPGFRAGMLSEVLILLDGGAAAQPKRAN